VVLDVTDGRNPIVKQRMPVGPTPGPLGTPSYAPYALVVSPVDGTVWVSDNKSGDVRVYDPTLGMMVDSRAVPVGGVAMFSAFTPDGKTLYVPHQGDDQLTAIEVASATTRTLPLPKEACLNAHAFLLDPSGNAGYVVCEGDHANILSLKPGSIARVTLAPLVVTGYVSVGDFPDGIAALPGG
jgi:DNA-binding beta-propeller fold protein YncE